MADGDALQQSALDRVTGLLDEVGDDFGVSTHASLVGDTGDGVAVQILAADGDADDQVCKLLAVLLDGLAQGVQVVLDGGCAGAPDAEQHGCVCVDGGLEGGDGVGRRAALHHGVQADRVEGAWGALEVGARGELAREVVDGLDRAVVVRAARVEPHDRLGRDAACEQAAGEGGSEGGAHRNGEECAAECGSREVL